MEVDTEVERDKTVGEKTQCLHFFLGKELSDIQNGFFPMC